MSKPRYPKKETLGRNILSGCWELKDLRKLDVSIGLAYDANKKSVEKYQDRMKKFDELFHEFTSNPKAFVEKYAKMDNNETVLEIIDKNPDWFKGLEWY